MYKRTAHTTRPKEATTYSSMSGGLPTATPDDSAFGPVAACTCAAEDVTPLLSTMPKADTAAETLRLLPGALGHSPLWILEGKKKGKP
mmetsp:Transcript_7744/g.14856  ORF Transcript_7744/g.14856 Transcript_7744/m.14856 type:complete len:88 (+) Transcript_7744:256-519(+)|eukprot:CAMPEP_0174281456 /NCGR_PEP_ID=MMETSP0809-20121228/1858_1 /TAXON_ID=73025 ORGANISM="Eutreptiella gymnastica-like, Strain CCMP1594" /NCGR_SAMPLE_ID=MMETSP0809 /ASSEMBLY_ACC=CAM_ASM_000658 /LENGTH=87 /DNA_ID=CAMNT_0015375039 /DNA_START=118 /DNA_END=381 /DNA_ORIENTATION=+